MMLYARLVAGRALGWCLLVTLLVVGMAGLTGAVEAADLGAAGAVRSALAAAVVAMVWLAPTLVAVGTAVTVVHMISQGEAMAAELAGIAPHRGAGVVLGVGLLLGGLQHLAADHLLWRVERLQSAVLVAAAPPSAWVWLSDRAVRVEDGVEVRLTASGGLAAVRYGVSIDAEALARARVLQRPQTASGVQLRSSAGVGAQLEQQSRRARALGCALLAAGAWLLGGSGARRVGLTLALALGWQGLDALLYAAASQGQAGLGAGAWGATALAAVGALGLAMRRWWSP